ncbi:hypothetical protein BXZ70DRAFT_945738 [Cristinia sonorae]|uniref:Copper acquisition factor BIM1-like domain-containing protein n=1 Tax=Cristinia sonorae TaxID=1940300 RepID=A0A8K0UMI0_9AGAR|nr:hypothetical protein BXZ70DRAFT_945738 [Cristinia sonorae]
MRVQSVAFLSTLLSVASAHFHLEFPPPRGPFVADAEVGFCDGYTNVTTNRTEFPLDGGFITWRAKAPEGWNFSVTASTNDSAATFDDFSTAIEVVHGFESGNVCLPVNLSKGSFKGLKDGDNVTLQMVYEADEGKLYQCADVTLRANFKIPSNITCANITAAPSPEQHEDHDHDDHDDEASSASRVAVSFAGLASVAALALSIL